MSLVELTAVSRTVQIADAASLTILGRGVIGGLISDMPPFPGSAAIFGLVVATVVATVVEALAGLIPAVIAARVKAIDAIRY
ncbi:MAG: transporter permease [Mycetocola sp.]|nr:transporter permease [Mycetocola sp.]